jgi:hypothetical protein
VRFGVPVATVIVPGPTMHIQVRHCLPAGASARCLLCRIMQQLVCEVSLEVALRLLHRARPEAQAKSHAQPLRSQRLAKGEAAGSAGGLTDLHPLRPSNA